jgi:hypothetical protein
MRQVETRLEKLSNNRNMSYEQGCSAELYTASQVKWAMGTLANSTAWNRNSYFQQAFLADFGSQILRYWSTEHSRREIWPKLSRAYYILVLFVITTAFKHRWFHRRHTKFWHEVRRCVHSSSAPRAAACRHGPRCDFCNGPGVIQTSHNCSASGKVYWVWTTTIANMDMAWQVGQGIWLIWLKWFGYKNFGFGEVLPEFVVKKLIADQNWFRLIN